MEITTSDKPKNFRRIQNQAKSQMFEKLEFEAEEAFITRSLRQIVKRIPKGGQNGSDRLFVANRLEYKVFDISKDQSRLEHKFSGNLEIEGVSYCDEIRFYDIGDTPDIFIICGEDDKSRVSNPHPSNSRNNHNYWLDLRKIIGRGNVKSLTPHKIYDQCLDLGRFINQTMKAAVFCSKSRCPKLINPHTRVRSRQSRFIMFESCLFQINLKDAKSRYLKKILVHGPGIQTKRAEQLLTQIEDQNQAFGTLNKIIPGEIRTSELNHHSISSGIVTQSIYFLLNYKNEYIEVALYEGQQKKLIRRTLLSCKEFSLALVDFYKAPQFASFEIHLVRGAVISKNGDEMILACFVKLQKNDRDRGNLRRDYRQRGRFLTFQIKNPFNVSARSFKVRNMTGFRFLREDNKNKGLVFTRTFSTGPNQNSLKLINLTVGGELKARTIFTKTAENSSEVAKGQFEFLKPRQVVFLPGFKTLLINSNSIIIFALKGKGVITQKCFVLYYSMARFPQDGGLYHIRGSHTPMLMNGNNAQRDPDEDIFVSFDWDEKLLAFFEVKEKRMKLLGTAGIGLWMSLDCQNSRLRIIFARRVPKSRNYVVALCSVPNSNNLQYLHNPNDKILREDFILFLVVNLEDQVVKKIKTIRIRSAFQQSSQGNYREPLGSLSACVCYEADEYILTYHNFAGKRLKVLFFGPGFDPNESQGSLCISYPDKRILGARFQSGRLLVEAVKSDDPSKLLISYQIQKNKSGEQQPSILERDTKELVLSSQSLRSYYSEWVDHNPIIVLTQGADRKVQINGYDYNFKNFFSLNPGSNIEGEIFGLEYVAEPQIVLVKTKKDLLVFNLRNMTIRIVGDSITELFKFYKIFDGEKEQVFRSGYEYNYGERRPAPLTRIKLP